MYEQIEKPKENKSRAIVNSVTQKKSNVKYGFGFVDNRPESIAQRKMQSQANMSSSLPLQKEENNTGLPDNLKSGVENFSGYSMDDVKVHYNSDKPAQLQAHAYAQGTDIHLGAGQEKHLPHEVWHVVQKKQGRVKPTVQMKGNVSANDDEGLEKEADVMGEKAIQLSSEKESQKENKTVFREYSTNLVQLRYDDAPLPTSKYIDLISLWIKALKAVEKGMDSQKSGVLGYRNMLTEEGLEKKSRLDPEVSITDLYRQGLTAIMNAGIDGWNGDIANGSQLTLRRSDGRSGGDSTERLIVSMKTGYMDAIEAAIRIAKSCNKIDALTYIKVSPPEDIYAGTGETIGLYLTGATPEDKGRVTAKSKIAIDGFAQLNKEKQPLTTTHLGGGISHAQMARGGASVSREYGTLAAQLTQIPMTEEHLATAKSELMKYPKSLKPEIFENRISDRTQMIMHFVHGEAEKQGMTVLGHFQTRDS